MGILCKASNSKPSNRFAGLDNNNLCHLEFPVSGTEDKFRTSLEQSVELCENFANVNSN